MAKMGVCRVCLAADISMHDIENTQVQEVFEKLTSKKAIESGRSETVCYLCYSQLMKCRNILNLFRKTEEVLTQLTHGGIEINQDTISFLKTQYTLPNIIDLLTTPARHIEVSPTNISTDLSTDCEKVTVKEEPKDDPQDDIEVEVKIEHIVEFEGAIESCIESDDGAKDSTWLVETPKPPPKKKQKKNKARIKTDPEEKTYICEFCNKIYHHRRNFQQHRKRHNNGELFKCEECDETFTFKTNLLRHCKIHENAKSYPCDKCDKVFARLDHISAHMRSHTGEKPYPCEICDMSFSTSSNVNQHIQSVHSVKRPFVCDLCNKNFNRKWNLQEHHLRVHSLSC